MDKEKLMQCKFYRKLTIHSLVWLRKFLGTVVQRYRPRGGGKPAQAFQKWVIEINSTVESTLLPILKECGMLLPQATYKSQKISAGDYCLATIRDFNSLIAKSQKANTPVFAITDEQLGYQGPVLKRLQTQRDQFLDIFSKFANKVIGLTNKWRLLTMNLKIISFGLKIRINIHLIEHKNNCDFGYYRYFKSRISVRSKRVWHYIHEIVRDWYC